MKSSPINNQLLLYVGWVFQGFMSIHLLTFASLKQISNLSEQRCCILQFFRAPCRKYYFLC
ncbi:MAG: hypothetical protein HRU34_12510 [Richelia sp.]|nr:hypothetical protein [Richelia sp.]CDN13001.1 hypothetical protein RintRC_1020 [Richelia intracellularis]